MPSLKNWKSLFIKTEEGQDVETTQPPAAAPQKAAGAAFSFPVAGQPVSAEAQPTPAADPALAEVLRVYESGLDSINMPGYDFYEFYQAISSTGQHASEGVYKMAFQMATTLDKTVSPAKLLKDAEFYISKINEVHGQYQSQGQQKINDLLEGKRQERARVNQELDQATQQINKMRADLAKLEQDVAAKRQALDKLDEKSYPAEKAVREKLNANDMARATSVDRLNLVKEGISRFLKG